MKNEDINTDTVVPKDIRIEVYKEAITLIEANEEKYGMPPAAFGLCLILPCILWDIKDYLDETVCSWSCLDTPRMFPEVTKEVIKTIERERGDEQYRVRLQYLNQWIQQLETERVHVEDNVQLPSDTYNGNEEENI